MLELERWRITPAAAKVEHRDATSQCLSQIEKRTPSSKAHDGQVAVIFFLLSMLWSRHVKPSSAKVEKRIKR